jgi:hypothetical protein
MAAAGATMLALVFSATSVVAVVWAFATLLGLPKVVLWVLLALGVVPVAWAALWTAQRAWHVEQLLEQGRDIDQPAFKVNAFWRRKQSEAT